MWLSTCQLFMTASTWGSWLIITFIFWHSAGITTEASTWVSADHSISVLNSLYSIWTLNIMLQEGDAGKSQHLSRGFYRVNPLQKQFKTVSTHSQNGSFIAYILIPDNEGAPWGGVGIRLKSWLEGEVSWQVDSRTLEEKGDIVREQLGGLRAESDGEGLPIAVDSTTQEFLWWGSIG